MSAHVFSDASRWRLNRWEIFRLLCDIVAPGAQIGALPPYIPWERLIEASSYHLVTPALAWAFRDYRELPDDAHQYLNSVLMLNRARNTLLMEALRDTLRVLNSHGIAVLLLKGAASLADDLYPDPGIRILGDVDILVSADRVEESSTLLLACGFEREAFSNLPLGHHHLQPLRHSATGMFLELHRNICGADYQTLLPLEKFWREAKKVEVLGEAAYLPHASERFAHALVHTLLQDGHWRSGTLTLRQMLELAVLIDRFRKEIRWDDIAARFRNEGRLAVLNQGCEIVHRLFGQERIEEIEPCPEDPLVRFREKLGRRFAIPSRLVLQTADAVRARPAKSLDYLNPRKFARRARRLIEAFRASRWTP